MSLLAYQSCRSPMSRGRTPARARGDASSEAGEFRLPRGMTQHASDGCTRSGPPIFGSLPPAGDGVLAPWACAET